MKKAVVNISERRLKPAAKATRPALSPEASERERALVDEYSIRDAGGLAILRTGMEAFDRMRNAQHAIARDGQTYRDRFGQIKAHPLLAVERNARAQYLAALRQLNLDVEPLRDRPGRPEGPRE